MHSTDTPSAPACDVAIIGGGLAGLHAAWLLHRAGRTLRLIEARDRLGGRILSVGPTGAPDPDGFDLGPSWIWPQMQPHLADLLATLGLRGMPQHAAGDILFDTGPHALPQRVRGMAAADPGTMRITGGTGALVQALARDVPAASIRLQALVTALALQADGVRITLGDGEVLAARHVIAALPPRLMADTIRLDPAPDAPLLALWRATPTWMAQQAKLVAVYDTPFWRKAGLSGHAQSRIGPLVEMHDATTASGRAALFGFVGVPAQQRASLSQDALIAACLAQLSRLFGPAAASPRATLIKDWASDPFTATALDLTAPGHPMPPAAELVSGPWADRLTLACSETSLTEPGYLAGAVEASSRAVRALTGQPTR
jgi:monoamine oxidase